MRFSLLLVAAILAGFPFFASAYRLTPSQALNRLGNSERKKLPAAIPESDKEYAPCSILNLSDGRPGAYLFKTTDSNLLLLGADSRTAPLLAVIPAVNNTGEDLFPPQMRWLLDSYMREIASLEEEDDSGDAAFKEMYALLDTKRPAVEPLLATAWNQDYPYNMLCPSSTGGNAVTGCVATAMAQVLAYHRWPEVGMGFIRNNAGIFDFDNTPFDWENMLQEYGDKNSGDTWEQRIAVAELMAACGIAVNMIYTANISGAYTMRIADALRNYFRYSASTSYRVRDVYSWLEWEDMLYKEVEAGRPVLYGGRGAAGGHSFVCDGYLSEGLFHFNWGWGGAYDGYFRISALNPVGLGFGGGSGQFNSDQDAIMGIYPDYEDKKETAPAELFSTGGFTGGSNYSNKGDRFELEFTIDRGAIINPSSTRTEGFLGILISDGKGEPEWNPLIQAEFAPIDDEGSMQPVTRFKGKVYYKDRQPGEYRIFPGFARSEQDAPQRIRVCDGTSQCLILTVNEDGTARILPDSSGVIPDIFVSDLTEDPGATSDEIPGVSFTLVAGSCDYEGPLYLTLTSETGGDEITVGSTNISISSGSALTSAIPITLRPAPGKYTVRLRDPLWRSVGKMSYYELESSASSDKSLEADESASFFITIEGIRIPNPPTNKRFLIKKEKKDCVIILL